ncbi:hypothetical protein BKA58DRAFT_466935 [Alternaria rosae]|uniref:uncharacterized protein n=1 Tax=Alternaria rosae TaxID=1187941 RepID=UPI001E8CBE9D|nr:uncharacterized protein BKA58DRAFT_466935 [Alternaria rosae]KAH6875079.1 hypothetical protein BKA58DRAFT_466935 [Alternaria rosae]
MADRPESPSSGGQETPRSEVDLDLALQFQELEINALKDTVAMQNEVTKDLRDTIAIQKEATQDLRKTIRIQEVAANDLRHVIKNLQKCNDEFAAANAALSAVDDSRVDQRNELQEAKIELAELRDEYLEVRHLQKLIEMRNSIEKALNRIIKLQDATIQKLKKKHGELRTTYKTKIGEHSAAINDLFASYEAKEAEVQELKDELQELREYCEGDEEFIDGSTIDIRQRDETIATLNAKVKEQDDALALSQQQLQEQHDTIAELEKQLTETKKSDEVDADRDEAIAESERQLKEKDNEIAELQEQLRKRVSDKKEGKVINELKAKVKQRDEAIVELEQQVQEDGNHIKYLKGWVKSLEGYYLEGEELVGTDVSENT